jgi:hypothetical protein
MNAITSSRQFTSTKYVTQTSIIRHSWTTTITTYPVSATNDVQGAGTGGGGSGSNGYYSQNGKGATQNAVSPSVIYGATSAGVLLILVAALMLYRHSRKRRALSGAQPVNKSANDLNSQRNFQENAIYDSQQVINNRDAFEMQNSNHDLPRNSAISATGSAATATAKQSRF